MISCKTLTAVLLFSVVLGIGWPLQAQVKTTAPKPDYKVTGYDTLYSGWNRIDSFTTDDRSLVIDNANDIYFIKLLPYKDNQYQQQKLYMLEGNKTTDVTPEPALTADWIFTDREGKLILRADEYAEGKFVVSRFFRRSNGAWEEIQSADSIKVLRSESYEVYKKKKEAAPAPPAQLTDVIWVAYPLNRTTVIANENGKGVVYEYAEGRWKKLLDMKERFSTYTSTGSFARQFLVKGNELYKGERSGVWKYNGADKYTLREKREYTIKPVPFAGNEADKAEAMDNMYQSIGIFEKNGKLGLRARDGTTVAYPVFNSITFEKSPHAPLESEDTRYLYHLTGNGMDVYCVKYNTDSNILTGYVESITACPDCNGTGHLTKTSYQKDKEWVETKTSGSKSSSYTTVWNSSCNCYVGVRTETTTSGSNGGYYIDKGIKEVTEDLGPCKACDGGRRSLTFIVNKYYFNAALNQYVLKPAEYKRSNKGKR